MKTFKKTINTPRLVIEYDNDAESPRNWDNLGFFFTKEGEYKSPDGNDNALYSIMLATEEEATDAESHIKLIKKEAKKQGENIVAIYPVYKYEHSAVVYKRGTARGFDYSNCGFYIVTKESMNYIGTPRKKKIIEKIIDQELQTYTNWLNGEVYRFTLYGKDGEEVDCSGGYYDIEDIREQLPAEWKNERLEEYLVN